MELQALLVLCGVGVAGIAVLLLMGLFSTSGTSYEEAIAQQRRAATELLALAESKSKPKKDKKEKKDKKKLAKKERKENAAATTGSEPESEAPADSGADEDPVPVTKPHVEFSPPIVVEVPKDTPPNIKIRKRGKEPKVKPILLNKEDPSCVSDPSAPPSPTGSTVSNHFEQIHPKDEFELLQSALNAEKTSEKKEETVEKKEPKSAKQTKGTKAPGKHSPTTENKEVAKDKEIQREKTVSVEGAKEQRKAKKTDKKFVSEEVVDAVREEIVPPLNVPQPSELTTDKLLKQALGTAPAPRQPSPPVQTAPNNPPAAAKGKNKKKNEPSVLSLMAAGDGGGVNVGELVRVVREAALTRNEIQILTDALLNKHHDQLPQHSEWTEGPNDPMQKLKKQLADKEKALADEIEASQALHAKLKELRANLNAERARAAASGRAHEQAAGAARAELHTLQTRLQRLLEDNHTLTQDKLLLQSKLGAEGEAQAQRVQMEMHIQRLSESEGALVAQLSGLQAELSARVLEAGQARCEAVAARDSLMLAQQHAADLAQQLQEANRTCSELESQRQCAVHNEQLAQQELRQMQERLNDLQNEVQNATSRAQIAESKVEKLTEEYEKQTQQLSIELEYVKEHLVTREMELAELKQMKVTQNGLPPNNEEHAAAELAKVEAVVESLRNELTAAQKGNREQIDQIAKLQDQLNHYQEKNNELRTKNWKVMEALQSAEKKALQVKSAQDTLREAVVKAQESQYKDVVSVLASACPAAAPNKPAGREWLQTFANNLKMELQKKIAPAPTPVPILAPTLAPTPANDAQLKEVVAQNENLKNLVDKYKRIIEDTEGVLSRLQQNVTIEEQRWSVQLADKQRELDELRQRTVTQMQKKIDTLEEQLQNVQAANHNHSFADSERLTEERLMSGLTDKYKDVSNGPLQVDLEEK